MKVVKNKNLVLGREGRRGDKRNIGDQSRITKKANKVFHEKTEEKWELEGSKSNGHFLRMLF